MRQCISDIRKDHAGFIEQHRDLVRSDLPDLDRGYVGQDLTFDLASELEDQDLKVHIQDAKLLWPDDGKICFSV